MPLRLYRDLLRQTGFGDVQGQDMLLGVPHELGEVLHWTDDPELNHTVVLKPQWLSDRISAVLDSDGVKERQGLLRSEDVESQWPDVDADLRRDLLHMLDKYDVSYRIEDSTNDDALAIVVDWLLWNPPDYRSTWDSLASATQVSVRYVFDGTIPPGIPTWFIAREHRFTTAEYRPWRTGPLLKHYDGKNFGLVELNRDTKVLDLTVRGDQPEKFMYLLDDGLQMTFNKYPGIKVHRKVPCPCEPGCDYTLNYEMLHRRRNKVPTVHCELTDEPIAIELLLRGIPPALADRDAELMLIQRGLTGLRNLQMVTCPTVFTLTPRYHRAGVRGYTLRLYCNEPDAWHQLPGDEGWLGGIAQHVIRVSRLLSVAATVATPILGMTDAAEKIKDELESMKGLLDQISQLPEPLDRPAGRADLDAEFRAVDRFLTTLDPARTWGGLSRTVTPEASVLFLCREHAERYRAPSPRPAGL